MLLEVKSERPAPAKRDAGCSHAIREQNGKEEDCNSVDEYCNEKHAQESCPIPAALRSSRTQRLQRNRYPVHRPVRERYTGALREEEILGNLFS